MKPRRNFLPLPFAVSLIYLGTLSPSNSVDDKINKTPGELMTTTLTLLSICLVLCVLWHWKTREKKSGGIV